MAEVEVRPLGPHTDVPTDSTTGVSVYDPAECEPVVPADNLAPCGRIIGGDAGPFGPTVPNGVRIDRASVRGRTRSPSPRGTLLVTIRARTHPETSRLRSSQAVAIVVVRTRRFPLAEMTRSLSDPERDTPRNRDPPELTARIERLDHFMILGEAA